MRPLPEPHKKILKTMPADGSRIEQDSIVEAMGHKPSVCRDLLFELRTMGIIDNDMPKRALGEDHIVWFILDPFVPKLETLLASDKG